MNLDEVLVELKKYQDLKEYRLGHINEVYNLCLKIIDNDLGSSSFKQLLIFNIDIFKANSKHFLGQEDWRKHINGIINSVDHESGRLKRQDQV